MCAVAFVSLIAFVLFDVLGEGVSFDEGNNSK